MRKRLPATRSSITTKVTGGNIEAYVTVGFYDNDQAGEIFIKVSKIGSFTATMMDTIAVNASVMLQMGVPLSEVLERWQSIKGDGGLLLEALAKASLAAISLKGGLPDKGYDL